MKFYHPWYFFCLMIFGIFHLSSVGAQTSAAEIRIVYVSNTTDMESQPGVGGLSELSNLVKSLRSQGRNVLFLHGGRALGPSPMGSFDKGVHMVDLLNNLEPDVMSVGQGEFSYSEDELSLRAREASFPIISSNLKDSRSRALLEGLHPWQILRVGKFKVGVLSLVDPEVKINYLLSRTDVGDPEASLRKQALELRKQGAQLLVLMTDFGGLYIEKVLKEGLIDLVFETSLGGDPRGMVQGKGFHVLFSTFDRAAVVGLTQVQGVWKSSIEWPLLKDIRPDPEIARIISGYVQRLSRLLDVEIGKITTPLDTQRSVVRIQETAFGNLVADALRVQTNSQLALINTGAIRGNRLYEAGTQFTHRMIKSELPHRNIVVKLEVTGQMLMDALENGLSRIEDQRGRFPALSGMIVTYLSNPVQDLRVVSVKIAGEDLVREKIYTLATVNFLADGGDDYIMFKGALRNSLAGEVILSDMVAAYIQKYKPLGPKVEGRLVPVIQP